MNIDLTFSKSPILFLIAIAVALVLSIWTYRYTIPPISKQYRTLLITLRTIAMTMVLFSLFEPVLTLRFRQNLKSSLCLLIDNSSSMEIKDDNKTRKEQLLEMLQSDEIKKLKSNYSIQLYSFSNQLDPLSEHGLDSLRFDGHATNIGLALKQLWDKLNGTHIGGVFLLSDGVQNQGEDVLRVGKSLDFPVFSVAIGKTEPKNDLILTEVTTNEITYVQNRVPVDVRLRGPGYGGKTVEILLEMDDKIVDRKSVPIPADNMEINTLLYFQPSTPGFQKITVRIPRLEEEFTDKNNHRDLMIRVLKNRLQVYLFSRAPGPDHASLVRSLESDETIHLTTRTQMKNGSFYEGSLPPETELKKADIFVFLDFPDAQTRQPEWQQIASVIHGTRIPIFLFAGKFLDKDKLQTLEPVLSFQSSRNQKETDVLPAIAKAGEGHPVLKISETEEENKKLWEQLPPVYTSWTPLKPLPENRILLTAVPEKKSSSSQEMLPLLIALQTGEQKVLIFTGHGFYRWNLLVRENRQNEKVMDHFLSQSLRWLSAPEAGKTVRLVLPKMVYSTGEQIRITADVYDETYTPVENAALHLKLTAPSSESMLQSVNMGNGRYQTSYRAHEAGTYRIVCEAFVRNRLMGRDTTEFSVTSFNPEFLDTHANPELLLALAGITGGKSGPPDSLAGIVQAMNFPGRESISTREIELYNFPLLLVITIVLLSLEWFIRKRKGMV
jgi:hypothetical protein